MWTLGGIAVQKDRDKSLHYTFLIIFSLFAFALWIVGMVAATKESRVRQAGKKAVPTVKLLPASAYVGKVEIRRSESVEAWVDPERFAVFLSEFSAELKADRVEFGAEWSTMAANPMTTQVEVQQIWADFLPVLGASAKGRRGTA